VKESLKEKGKSWTFAEKGNGRTGAKKDQKKKRGLDWIKREHNNLVRQPVSIKGRGVRGDIRDAQGGWE